jgi:hypothetical protein
VQRLRWWFLLFLNWHAPSFWRTLRDDVLIPRDADAFVLWTAKMGVVDSWLIQAAADTLLYWTANPESPQARLEPGAIWIFWRGALVVEKPFEATFSDALPRSQNGQLESPAEFGERMRSQFEEQQKVYRKEYESGYYTAQHYFGQHPGVKDHMLWLVCRFAGVPLETVLKRWPGARLYEDPKATFVRKVNELAKKIGLTLRPWTPK